MTPELISDIYKSGTKFNNTYGIPTTGVLFYLYKYALQSLKAYCAIWIRRFNFLPPGVSMRVTTREHPVAEGGTVGEKMSGKFCLNTDSQVTFRDLLQAVKLRHGTDGFTSPPKEGVLRIFFRPKNPTASAGFELANLGTKGQHATSIPPKPLTTGVSITGYLIKQSAKASVRHMSSCLLAAGVISRLINSTGATQFCDMQYF